MVWNRKLMETRLPALVSFALERKQEGVVAADLVKLPKRHAAHTKHKATACRLLAKLVDRAEALGVKVTVGEARRGKRGPKATVYVVEEAK